MNETVEESREFRDWGGLWRQPWWRCSQEDPEGLGGGVQLFPAELFSIQECRSGEGHIWWMRKKNGGISLVGAGRTLPRFPAWSDASGWGHPAVSASNDEEDEGQTALIMARRGNTQELPADEEEGEEGCGCALAAALPQSLTGLAESSCVRTSEWTDPHRSQSSVLQEAPAEPCQPDGRAAFQKGSF